MMRVRLKLKFPFHTRYLTITFSYGILLQSPISQLSLLFAGAAYGLRRDRQMPDLEGIYGKWNLWLNMKLQMLGRYYHR
jgi:hypothetical protein